MFQRNYPTLAFAATGTTADQLLLLLDHRIQSHNYPYRVFVHNGDTRPFYPRSLLIYHCASRSIWIGREDFRQRMVHLPGQPATGRDADFGSLPHLEHVKNRAFAEFLVNTWVASASVRHDHAGSVQCRWREVMPHAVCHLMEATPQDLLPTDYFEALRVMWTHRQDAPTGVATKALSRLHQMQHSFGDSRSADDRPVRWRGLHMSAHQYKLVRGWFKDPQYIDAVRQSLQDGDSDALREYYQDSGVPQMLGSSARARFVGDHSDNNLVVCDCDHVEHAGYEVRTTDGEHTYCDACASEEFVEVVEGGLYHREDVYYWESDGEYHCVEEPEEDDEDDDHLLASWGASTSHLRHDRSFTPSAYGDFTMGIELEVESQGSRRDDIVECADHFNADMTYAMFKRDGSLSEAYGFEIVTAARKLGDHVRMFKEWAVPSDLRAWSAGNCGMHVHIDSRAFTALHLGKFLQLYNDPANREFIRAIAGRHPDTDSSADSYAQRLNKPINLNPATIKKGAGTSRYRMVNLTNLTHEEARRLDVQIERDSKGSYSTVEIRIFRATLKKERLLAQIEFAHASVAFTRVAGNHQLNGRAFIDWLGSVAGQYKHLARWFNVYVPRPTKQRPTVRTRDLPEFA